MKSGFLLLQHGRKETVGVMAMRQHHEEVPELFLLEVRQCHPLLGEHVGGVQKFKFRVRLDRKSTRLNQSH